MTSVRAGVAAACTPFCMMSAGGVDWSGGMVRTGKKSSSVRVGGPFAVPRRIELRWAAYWFTRATLGWGRFRGEPRVGTMGTSRWWRLEWPESGFTFLIRPAALQEGAYEITSRGVPGCRPGSPRARRLPSKANWTNSFPSASAWPRSTFNPSDRSTPKTGRASASLHHAESARHD